MAKSKTKVEQSPFDPNAAGDYETYFNAAGQHVSFRTPYIKFKRDDGIKFAEQGLTKQSFRDECDINNIMRKFERTGTLPELIKSNPQYGDFSDLPTYQESLHVVHKAEEQFMALSAKVRQRFENDPSKFLDFVSDPANKREMEDLGLLEKPKRASEVPVGTRLDEGNRETQAAAESGKGES